MVEICFNNMVDFFFFYNTLSSFVSLTGKLISSKPLYFVTCVFQLLNCENGVYNYVQNISRSSVQVKSCNKKGDIYSKSWLFPSGFSQSARCIDELKSRTTKDILLVQMESNFNFKRRVIKLYCAKLQARS